MKNVLLGFLLALFPFTLIAQKPVPVKPRILISTDIGGTDPDDNQSMTHFLMYCNRFETEGLVSSPSYGYGTKQHILNMIDLYKSDLPKLSQHQNNYPKPDALRAVCKQGRQGAAPFKGYTTATEGSDWIIHCAHKKSEQPLWVLVWGGLEDLAQALHDDSSIQTKIKVYWIGGPNKKWSANAYAYIAQNFPNLWFIEANGSYNGFFSTNGLPDSLSNSNYYDRYIRAAGQLGKDFKNYYKGNIKMGDTPSLLYMMDGNPNDPLKESWGGSFEKINHSPRTRFTRNTTLADTVGVYSVMEFHLKGPKINIRADSACITMTVQAQIGEQKWPGYYLGNGNYAIKYVPKQTETLTYTISSPIPGFPPQSGKFVVNNTWPGKRSTNDFVLGTHWYSDRKDLSLFDDRQQGGKTVLKWRSAVLLDWARRWAWLYDAQLKPTGGRDTSFTVKGSYLREKKNYPDISLADSTLPAGIRVDKAITYSKPIAGRELKLDVFAQPVVSGKARPAIVMIHGGGWRSGDRSHNNTLAGQLAAKGFVAVPVEYRLSTEALYPAAVHDIKAAIRWVQANAKKYGVDPNRMVVLGFSAGGQLAALVGTTNGQATFDGTGGNARYSSAVQAIVDIDGVLAFIHPESGEGDDSKSISAATYWFGYSKTKRPDLWQEASALNHIDKHTPPILFLNSSVERMHGGRDDLIKKLNNFGIYSEVHTFPDAPHTFMFFNPWFTPTLTYITNFLNKVLPAK
ncbi:nucleoside hydrolase-like domain-containing protein [Spirosoma pollinicola]|uniref:Esterase n=1 Tax=Spirosoma pollinicola TaxID=2057025 RepID=A0A2K8YTJ0_9BACT|nr:nucleoside hydrolase-like domain-containing protein [Spirosoma pollinicola]AUD00888.1 hypothetical protein CWM47_03090 [Spirosoma pollinicola]